MRIPAARVLLCLVKMLTVNGIIGKTHGVISAAKPPRKLRKNIVHNPFSSLPLAGTSVCALAFASVTAGLASGVTAFSVVTVSAVAGVAAAVADTGISNVSSLKPLMHAV